MVENSLSGITSYPSLIPFYASNVSGLTTAAGGGSKFDGSVVSSHFGFHNGSNVNGYLNNNTNITNNINNANTSHNNNTSNVANPNIPSTPTHHQ